MTTRAFALGDLIEGQIASKRELREMEDRLICRLTRWLGGIVVACSAILLVVLPLIIRNKRKSSV